MDSAVAEASTDPVRKRWTRAELLGATEAGVFRPGARLELIGGEVLERMTPQKSPHATAVRKCERALARVFTSGADVRGQLPLALGDYDEPEPDVAVVPGKIEDYRDEHPTSAYLVVEVSDSTLKFDRGPKASLYARAGIPEYWIVNLRDEVLEVHRDPAPMVEQPFGHHYRSISRLPLDAEVDSLTRPGQALRVGELFP
jgi:Uma2 family endonuclease